MTPAYVSVKRWRNPMDDPFISQLRQLSPTVDAKGSKIVLDRRLKRSRTRRRTLGAGFGAAGLALVTFTVTQIASRPSNDITIVGAPETDEPITLQPDTTQPASTNPPPTAEPQPASDVPFEVLSDAQFTSEVDLLDAVIDEFAFPGWWTRVGLQDPTPVVDFSQSVVVAFTVANPSGSACSVLVGFTAEKSADGSILSLTPNIEDRPETPCRWNFVPKRSFVVAIDRAAVTQGFTLTLPASTDPAYDERALFVNVSGGQLATPPQPISVSYGDDTPFLEPVPFVKVDDSPEVAVGDGRIVVVDSVAATATIIYNTPSPAKIVGLDVVPWLPVINPTADVLYGLHSADSLGMMEMVAIALEGPRQGEVVATSPLSIGAYIESPSGAFGHGDNGIVDRFPGGQIKTLIDYVDASGLPTKISGPWSHPASSDFDYANSMLGISSNAATWTLRAERSPDAANLFEGETPPAPTAEGGVLVFTHIGPRVEPQADFGTPTGPVVAVLRPDGSGKWYRLPEGWSVAASDIWGTVLSRRVGTNIELAWLNVEGVQYPLE
jgi:hypothetical protein